jgi:hypothetical protein
MGYSNQLRARVVPAVRDVLAFGRSARATHSAQVAGRRDIVVAAAPWELRAFFVPAAMCSRSVAWRG